MSAPVSTVGGAPGAPSPQPRVGLAKGDEVLKARPAHSVSTSTVSTSYKPGRTLQHPEAKRNFQPSVPSLRRMAMQAINQVINGDLDESDFGEQIELAEARVKAARRELAEAEEFAASAERAWEQIAAIIDESRNIAEAWDRMDPGERRILFSYWVEELHIVVEPIRGKRRANNKTAVVWLRNVPGPQYFPIGRQLPIAEEISSETQGSDSSSARSASASAACGEPTSPNAQAACPRTSADESESASASTGTADSDPQLPSATDRLRAKPSRPARRIAEPRENESQAASSRAVSSSSTSDGESVPGCQTSDSSGSTPAGESPGGRAAYEGSEEGAENLRVKGHTSWEISHPYLTAPGRRGSLV
jgi:hypothetical protein